MHVKIVQGISLPLRVSNGAVSSGNTICNDIAVKILQEGGNAVDAAITAAICLGARNCFASGIGGGAIALVYTKDKKMFYADGRETAPAGASRDMLLQNGALNPRGGPAVAVPGEIKLLYHLYERYASKKLSWARLLEPTIQFTREGFPVHTMLERNLDSVSKLVLADDEMRSVFAPNGTLLRLGEIVKMPKLSRTLELIAQNGSEAMYGGGWLTETMVKEINAKGGVFRKEDIQNYDIKIRAPVSTTWRNLTISSAYPPISGGVSTVMALNILENFDLESMGWTAESIHIVVEAIKFAFAHRLGLGDPDFVDISSILARMLDKSYAKSLAEQIKRNTTQEPSFYFGDSPHVRRWIPVDAGTTHISVVDSERNVVSMTTTVNAEFGAVMMGEETGIIYNNQMDDFSTPGVPNYYGLAPSESNFIQPGKRPVSSMTPLIITRESDGAPVMTIGGTGGPRIFTNVLQSVLNILRWGRNIKASTLMPRFHHQLYPNELRYEYENPLPESIVTQLKRRNHKMVQGAVGVVNGVHIVDGGATLEAASDWRKRAESRGY